MSVALSRTSPHSSPVVEASSHGPGCLQYVAMSDDPCLHSGDTGRHIFRWVCHSEYRLSSSVAKLIRCSTRTRLTSSLSN